MAPQWLAINSSSSNRWNCTQTLAWCTPLRVFDDHDEDSASYTTEADQPAEFPQLVVVVVVVVSDESRQQFKTE